MEEIWKDIKDFEGLYEISNTGKVRRKCKKVLRTNPKKISIKTYYTYKEKLLSLKDDKDGYKFVQLTKDKKVKNLRVHRLVAEAFIPNINNYNIVNHIDENKSNNNVDNLEWCTYKYNTNYGQGILRRAISQGKPIIYNNTFYYSIGIAAKLNNISTSVIFNKCKNNIDNCRYATEKEIEDWKNTQRLS